MSVALDKDEEEFEFDSPAVKRKEQGENPAEGEMK